MHHKDHTDSDMDEKKFLHDLSNPLAVVYGNLQLIVSKLEKDLQAYEPEDLLHKLQKSAQYLDIVADLLDKRRVWLRNKE